jgi:purine nucleoside permease
MRASRYILQPKHEDRSYPMRTSTLSSLLIACLAGLAAAAAIPAKAATTPANAAAIPVKVVVVTTFELGEDRGDAPGEFQTWVEKLPLLKEIPAPGTYHGVMRYNPELQVLGIVTGEGPEHASSAMTALLTDARFDLRHAYFLLAGISGIDPNFGSVGSAVWAPHVVNGGLAHEIDAREIPADWPDGFTPIQGSTPEIRPVPPLHSVSGDMAYTIDPELLGWAFSLTRNIVLPDGPELQKTRARYVGFPRAQTPPLVSQGDTLASATFWTGARMNQWAERWVKYWTQSQGVMATTAEEDLGFMQALSLQAQAGRVDMRRVLVLRTASNYDMPPSGEPAAALLAAETQEQGYSGYRASLEAAYVVGSAVVKEICNNWPQFMKGAPGSEATAPRAAR